jgi:hypothetical protein
MDGLLKKSKFNRTTCQTHLKQDNQPKWKKRLQDEECTERIKLCRYLNTNVRIAGNRPKLSFYGPLIPHNAVIAAVAI